MALSGVCLQPAKVIGARLAASRMREIVTQARPLVDCKQYIRQVDVGYTPADLCVESLHTFWEVLALVHRHDSFPVLDADTLATIQHTVDPG